MVDHINKEVNVLFRSEFCISLMALQLFANCHIPSVSSQKTAETSKFQEEMKHSNFTH